MTQFYLHLFIDLLIDLFIYLFINLFIISQIKILTPNELNTNHCIHSSGLIEYVQ